MERRQPDGIEHSLETRLDMIRQAGFDGISVSYENAGPVGQVAPFLAAHGMAAQAMCLPTSIDALKPVLENVVRYGADHVNLQPDLRPRTLPDAIRILEGWLGLAREAGVPVYIETHRDRLTSDLFF